MCKNTYINDFLACKKVVVLATNMKKLIQSLSLVLLCAFISFGAQAQLKKKSPNKISVTGSADASMLQLALVDNGISSEISTLRYTYYWNMGFDFNYKVAKNLTLYSGLALKNLGYIQKNDSATSKVRTYNIGVPLGLKIGNLKGSHLMIGGGVDFPINLKEKYWVNGRSNKVKGNEWFSDLVNPVQPFATIGYRFKVPLKAKFHYYPTNFWNSDYNNNLTVNLMVLTLGFDINRNKGSKVRELRTPKNPISSN